MINIKEFEKMEREDIAISGFETTFGQVIIMHPVKSKAMSENYKSAGEELNKKWELRC